MAYKTEELKEKALNAIKSMKLVFIEEVAAFIGISKGTFYEHKLNELNEIKDAIEANKSELKAGLRKKWYENENATTQLALYRLLSTPEEHQLLNQQYIDHTTGGDKLTGFEIVIKK